MHRLIIDCQILQTPAFNRGMGKYTLSLLREFLRENDKTGTYTQVHILLSKSLDVSKTRLTEITDQLSGRGVSLDIIDLPIDLATNMLDKYAAATLALDRYIEGLPDVETDFLIMAPFFANFAATFPTSSEVRKFSIVYDLIPHKVWNLLRIFPDDVYFHHYQILIAADHLFTISNAVKDDLVNLVGLPPDSITNIDGGPFVRTSSGSSEWSHQDEKYVLMPSGPIVHKNNERAVKAFEQFNKKHDNAYTLYITSDFDDGAQTKLRALSQKVAFTGNISDDSLGDAYKNASAVLFPSMAEGLGMPVLEAALDDVPVACSNIPVLMELSEDAFYQFDPTSLSSIEKSIEQAVIKGDWDTHLKAYVALRHKYTWERSARVLQEALSSKLNRTEPTEELELIIPRPNHGTPAGYLGELLYARLANLYKLSLHFSEEGTIDTPSYVAYVQASNEADADTKVELKTPLFSKVAFWKQMKTVEIVVSKQSWKEKNIIFATPSFDDKQLQLRSWKYMNTSKDKLSIDDLILDITTKYQSLSQEVS